MIHDKLVYVIVLNYNGKQHLEYCLPSILKTKYENYRIIVVDNNSSDNSVDYVKKNHPEIAIIQCCENKGWAGGNNVGISYAKEHGAEYVVLANNDIKVHPLWVQSAVNAFESDSCVGFVGCNVFGAVRAEPVEDFNKACDEWKQIEYNYTDEYIDGMVLFVRSSVFDNLGMIDEAFFVYAEETDFEIRGKLAGYKRIKTNVPIWHYSSGTFKEMKIKGSYLAIRNQIRLAIKHEDFLKVLKVIASTYKTGCNPFFKGDMTDATIYRLRPRGLVFNFSLITYCVLWNLFKLKSTLKQKQKDYENIKKIKNFK